MALINDVEIWFPKLNPDRPNSKFNKTNPTWECQVRTRNAAKAKEMREKNIRVKDVIPEDGSPPYYRANLRKKSLKAEESIIDGVKTVKMVPSGPVKIIDGDFAPVNPDIIGNGSLANIRVYQYEYPKQEGGTGIANVLMAIQLTRHVMYTPKPFEDNFEKTSTEVVPEAPENPEKDYGDNPMEEKSESAMAAGPEDDPDVVEPPIVEKPVVETPVVEKPVVETPKVEVPKIDL